LYSRSYEVATLSVNVSFKINHLHRFVSGFFVSTSEIRENVLWSMTRNLLSDSRNL